MRSVITRKLGFALLLGVLLAAAGCGAPDDDADAANDLSTDSRRAPETDEDPRYTWLMSDERPINRACNEPGYRRGQPDTYPALHSHLYPVIQERLQGLMQQVQALAPQVTDEDVYDLEADLLLRGKINVLNQFVFFAGQDLAPHYLLSLCNIESYAADQCAQMQSLLRSTVVLDDFSREGDALSYSARLVASGARSTIHIANEDLDGIRLESESVQQGNYRGQWQRADDGTETFSAQGTDGTFRYTEKPDCSGTAQAIRNDDGGHLWELSWSWTSVREPSAFSMQYTNCKVNGLDERECASGGL